jgi:hypothetical protein
VRIHLGHHFYGAGNLGDDFMLAGFLAAMRVLAPRATYTCSVPFALEAMRRRFPEVSWHPYETALRERCIAECDVWLGLGGSPFQHALSRWFVDHLAEDMALCERGRKPMFYLGIGVQSRAELIDPVVRRLAAHAAGIWTRDPASAEYLASLPVPPPIEAAADLAHVFFRDGSPPAARAGRLTFVPNFDYHAWPAQDVFLGALEAWPARERIWLAQETRELPGAERALHAALPAERQARWRLEVPDVPGAPLAKALGRWPSGEWLVTARFHAALAGAWAGSRVVVIATNEKLRAAARELHCPSVSPDTDAAGLTRALHAAAPARPGHGQAERAFAACEAFAQQAAAHGGARHG